MPLVSILSIAYCISLCFVLMLPFYYSISWLIRHDGGIIISINLDSSSSRYFPSLGVTTGFFTQSISTLEGLDLVGVVIPRWECIGTSESAIATMCPILDQLPNWEVVFMFVDVRYTGLVLVFVMLSTINCCNTTYCIS